MISATVLIVLFTLASLSVVLFLILLPLTRWRRHHQPLRSRGRMIYLNLTSLLMGSTIIALLIRLFEDWEYGHSTPTILFALLILLLHLWKSLIFLPYFLQGIRICGFLWMRSQVQRIIPHIKPPQPPPVTAPAASATLISPRGNHKNKNESSSAITTTTPSAPSSTSMSPMQDKHELVLRQISLTKRYISVRILLPLTLCLIVLDSVLTLCFYLFLSLAFDKAASSSSSSSNIKVPSQSSLLIVFCAFSAHSRSLVLLVGMTFVVVLLFYQREKLRLRFEMIALLCFSFFQSSTTLFIRLFSVMFPSVLSIELASDLVALADVVSTFIYVLITILIPLAMTFRILPHRNRSDLADQLIQTLRQPKTFLLFKQWAEREWSHENLLFIEAVEAFRHSNDLSQALSIYEHFISEEGLLSLSISRELRERIRVQLYAQIPTAMQSSKRSFLRSQSSSSSSSSTTTSFFQDKLSPPRIRKGPPSDLFDPVVEEVMQMLLDCYARFSVAYRAKYDMYLEEKSLSKAIASVASPQTTQSNS